MTIAMQPEEATNTSAARRELPPSMVERMTLILDTFPGRESRHTLEEIARMTHLPRSTAHRILDQLVRLEWLEHTSFGYCLGRRALGLGGGTDDHSDLRAAAAPHLHDVLLRTGAVVHLGVLDGGQVRYLDKMGGRFASVVPSRVGGWAPAHCTALGKAMLAWIEPEEVDLLIGDQLSARTAATIAELGDFHHELSRIRARNGLALEVGECFENIACAAAAIRGPRGPVAALSVVGESGMPVERVAPLVVNAARRIARDLFGEVVTDRRLASVR